MYKIEILPIIFSLVIIPYLSSEINASPAVHDNSLHVYPLAEHIASSREFISVGNNIFLIYYNSDKVSLIKDGILKKYPILDLTSDKKSIAGLVGISSDRHTNGSRLVLGYVTSTSEDLGSHYFDELIFQYDWNMTGLELVNPKRMIQVPIHAEGLNETGRMILSTNDKLYLVVDNITNQTNDPETGYNESACSTRLIRVPTHNLTSVLYYPGFGNQYDFIGCIEGSLKGLTLDEETNSLGAIQSFPGKGDEIILVNTETNKTHHYVLCSHNLIRVSTFDLGKATKDSFCPPKDQSYALTSLAFKSEILGDKYLNHIFVADSNGSIYDTRLESGIISNATNIPIDIYASGFGEIFKIQATTKGLYVLAEDPEVSGKKLNKTERTLYLISSENQPPIKEDLIKFYDRWSLLAIGLIISSLLGALFYNWRKIHNSKKRE